MKYKAFILIAVILILIVFLVSCIHDHEFKEWIIVVPPKCEESGIERRPCECGEYEERYIPAKGHKVSDWIIDVEPTESETGLKHKECFDCMETIEAQIIPPRK